MSSDDWLLEEDKRDRVLWHRTTQRPVVVHHARRRAVLVDWHEPLRDRTNALIPETVDGIRKVNAQMQERIAP